ncbi:MAG: hypothetical protein H6657_15010 [Ardenticatenaceae bacterium]|nr:hypothetical protein [Ardenticatenaceae bacterium]
MDDNVYQQLANSLIASNGSQNPDLSELFRQQLDDADPKVKAIANYLIKRQAEIYNSEEVDDNEELMAAEPILEPDLSRRTASYNRLRRVTTKMYAELEDLRERNDTLAAALGSCYLCWGEDPDCEECQGRGKVGAFTPDKELFRQYVAPVVQTLKIKQQARHARKEGATQG